MAEKSLFYNALPDPQSVTGYDRNYNADDISDFYRFSFNNGVVKSNSINNEPQGLKVVASSNMNINVNAGYACINGKPYINTALKSFTITPNGTSVNRYDYVVLRYDNNMSVRNTYLALVTGTSAIPTVNSLTRNDKVYELMLGYITVPASATVLTQANITDTRGKADLCEWFTAVKGTSDYYDAIVQTHEFNTTLSSASTTVITDLPSKLYNAKYSLIDVYTNGLREPRTAYTASLNAGYIVITFTSLKSAGAKITVNLDNFLDGEGMTTVIGQYTELVNEVAKLNAAGEYNYICNGSNDNVLIGNIVRAYLQGGSDYGTMKLNVIGNIGMSAPAYGDGSSASPYAWFNFNIESNRNVIVDFTRAGQINPIITGGTYTNIFHSNNDIHVIGANVVASNTTAGTNIRIISTASGVVKFENCRFYITSYQDGLIAIRGTFINCRGSVANVINNSYCFLPVTNGVVKIIGGEYYAYTGDSNRQSAIVGQSGADAVSILYGVSAPTSARSGFYQTNSLLQWAGGGIMSSTDLISELPLVVVSGISNIRGTIAKSKTNVW